MKQRLAILTLFLSAFSYGQNVLFSAGEDKTVAVTSVSSIEDADFELSGYLICSDEKQKEINDDFDGIQTELTINGQVIETSGFLRIDHLFSFEDEGDDTYLQKPSIQSEIPLEDIVHSYGKYMVQNGNSLKITYLFKGEIIGAGTLTFNIQEFMNPTADFCDFAAPYLTTEPTFISAISQDFAANNPTSKVVKIWLPYALSKDDEGLEETSGSVLFSQDNDYRMVKYSVTRLNGEIVVQADSYSLISNLHPECVKAFLARE